MFANAKVQVAASIIPAAAARALSVARGSIRRFKIARVFQRSVRRGIQIRRTADEARQCSARVLDAARTVPVQPLGMAWAYMGIGDERAFEWLEKAIDARDPAVTHLPSMPMYDGIRGDARFRGLLAKMGLA